MVVPIAMGGVPDRNGGADHGEERNTAEVEEEEYRRVVLHVECGAEDDDRQQQESEDVGVELHEVQDVV